MWHEQMRSDRDDWIRINFTNIIPNQNWESQFMKQDTLNYVQYNYGSVMQYSPRVCASITICSAYSSEAINYSFYDVSKE